MCKSDFRILHGSKGLVLVQANAPSLECSQPTTISRGTAKTQLELLIKEIENLQDTVKASEHDPDSMFFLLLRAGIVETLQRVQAAQARELLPPNEPAPFVGREDGHGFSLKRLKPYLEIGTRKGNYSKPSVVSAQENSMSIAEPFSRPPEASRPKTMMEHLDASRTRAKRQKATPLQPISANACPALLTDRQGLLQPDNPTISFHAQALTQSADFCAPSINSLGERVQLPTSSNVHAGAPLPGIRQPQVAKPTAPLQHQALRPLANLYNAIPSPLYLQGAAEVQAGAPFPNQLANDTPSLQAQIARAPLSFHQAISYPFVQDPLQLYAWHMFNQLAELVPHSQLDKQLCQQTQQVTSTPPMSSDRSSLPQQRHEA
jgi:hypothetical protein